MASTLTRLCLGFLSLSASFALTAAQQQTADLGGPILTPVGAERQGNAAGTIPPWTGGLHLPVPGYVEGEQHPDPYADDPILFTVDAGNMARYAEQLSEGQKVLLQAYPSSWYINVYPTRRSASYPDFVYEAIKTNATQALLIEEGLGGVRNATVSSPFPLPSNGLQVVWNHTMRWRGIYIDRREAKVAVTGFLGNYEPVISFQEMLFPYAKPGTSPLKAKFPGVLFAARQRIITPAGISGSADLILESYDFTAQPRRTWAYSPELRKIFATPFTGFDTPAALTDALRTVDQWDLYNGSPSLYDWKLLGKREMLIPYNAYRLHSGDVAINEIIQEHHINPALARYELHRVWVVEGTLKPDKKQIYSKRVFYLDEDSWQIALTENYDKKGRFWRAAEGHMVNYYQVPVPWYTLTVYYDFWSKRYLVEGLDNGARAYRFSGEGNPLKFSPSALNFYVR
jgi:hypothetical protein